MPSKPARRERYQARAMRFFERSVKSFRIMTRRYEELGRLQDYLRQHPEDQQIRSIFETKRKAFLDSQRMRDRIQQAAVAYQNYMQEPGAEPIRIRKSELDKATRKYYGKLSIPSTATHPEQLPDYTRAAHALPAPKKTAAKFLASPQTQKRVRTRLESLYKEYKAEKGADRAAVRNIFDPLAAHAKALRTEEAHTHFILQLNRITQLLNQEKKDEARALLTRLSQQAASRFARPLKPVSRPPAREDMANEHQTIAELHKAAEGKRARVVLVNPLKKEPPKELTAKDLAAEVMKGKKAVKTKRKWMYAFREWLENRREAKENRNAAKQKRAKIKIASRFSNPSQAATALMKALRTKTENTAALRDSVAWLKNAAEGANAEAKSEAARAIDESLGHARSNNASAAILALMRGSDAVRKLNKK